jgi:hypothetical protein
VIAVGDWIVREYINIDEVVAMAGSYLVRSAEAACVPTFVTLKLVSQLKRMRNHFHRQERMSKGQTSMEAPMNGCCRGYLRHDSIVVVVGCSFHTHTKKIEVRFFLVPCGSFVSSR